MSSASGPTPPQPPHDFSYNPSRVSDAIKTAIERTRKLEDEIAALKPEDCTFDSVVKPLALDEAVMDTQTDPAGFMQSVSKDKLVRDAATEASMKLSDFGIEVCLKYITLLASF
jgi:metallopeptidase MepB